MTNQLRLPGLILLLAAASAAAVLDNGRIRVETRLVEGRLTEQYLARDGARWVEVAEFRASGRQLRRTIVPVSNGPWLRVTTRMTSASPSPLHSFADHYRFLHPPDWTFSPSVGGFNPDAQYKAPLILVQSGRLAFAIVPDVTVLTREQLKRCSHALDLDVPAGPLLTVGFIPSRRAFHSVFEEDQDALWTPPSPLENSYYLYVSATAAPREAYREAVRFHWDRFASPALPSAAASQAGTHPKYKSLALWEDWRRMAWDLESPEQWLHVPLPGGGTGGAVRMIRWGSPRPSLYLGAWFNSMRTAHGMALYARRQHRPELMELARETLRAALQAPGVDGAFKCIAVPADNATDCVWAAGDGSGRSVRTGFLGFDMSWTGYWLLQWRAAGLPDSDQVLARCRRLADFLIARQSPDGMLPTRFDADGAVDHRLSRQLPAETGPVVRFLLALHDQDPRPRYLDAARKGLAFLDSQVVPQRKWYDFETFWSCSPRLEAFDARTAQWPANNLALLHTVAAYLAAHRATGESAWLARGESLLDYLLLYQQSWTNPVLEGLTNPHMLLGGFTTQNSDAEWSDARQSLCGNVLLDYYRATGKVEYLERGVSALRAQFPVSPSENWAHGGYGGKAGVSGFHWGTGSGMATVEIEEDYLRDAVIDLAAARGVGVNGLNLVECRLHGHAIHLRLESPFQWKRKPVVVFHRGDPAARYSLLVNGAALGQFTTADLEKGIPVPLR